MMVLQKFEKSVLWLFIASVSTSSIASLLAYLLLSKTLELNEIIAWTGAFVIWLSLNIIFGIRHTRAALRPTSSVYLALQHLAEGPSEDAPPKPENYGISKDIVTQIIDRIYKLSSGQHENQTKLVSSRAFSQSILNLGSTPIFVLDRNRQIVYVNKHASDAMPESVESPLGMTIDKVLSLEFSSGITFDQWLSDAQANKIQEHHLWERIRIFKTTDSPHYYDMVADYNKNEPHGIETTILLLDKTLSYRVDDEQLDLISLAVHELRGPISLIRGYIEVLNEELETVLTTDQQSFIQKLEVSASQLSTFVNNILNVSRIENDQLKAHLQEDTIYDALEASRADLTLRSEVKGRKLSYQLADGIPSIGLDRTGIYEVMSNLIDNAIKYSEPGGKIIISAVPSETSGVTVSIQDFGVGIPKSAMANLFQRFYRSHHSKDRVPGTGLGLFLSKTIIEAHSGTIWVKSVEGKGSTFGFDLPTYQTLKNQTEDDSTLQNPTIDQAAHGWIKNHGKVRK